MTLILVVDDELGIRETFQAFLEDEGYDVVVAADFFEAESVLAEHSYDVVVLDIVLPRVSGLDLLRRVKEIEPQTFTKSGIMVGLGEEHDEVVRVMDDMREVDVDFITIGQYLRPTQKHLPMARYAAPEEFEEWAEIAWKKGFLRVASSPLTRSSYHADEDFAKLSAARRSGAGSPE